MLSLLSLSTSDSYMCGYICGSSAYVASDLDMLFFCLTSAEWETIRGEKKMWVKENVFPEHTHRLRNRHGPMVAQRCSGAKTNSSRKLALVSCFELPKGTQNKLRFGLFLFEMTSYQFVLRFRLKYIRAFRSSPFRIKYHQKRKSLYLFPSANRTTGQCCYC